MSASDPESGAFATEAPPSEAERLFAPLLRHDPSGRTWLPGLLAAAPRGREHLGELVEDPGSLSMTSSVPGIDGRLGAFTYPSAAPPALSRWFIEHPERLTWPADAELSTEASRLLRMLLHDEPSGSRRPAQERALELLRTRSILSREWWRFEPTTTLGCVLVTPRLALTVTVVASDALAVSTDWFPARTALVRDLESARGLAEGLPFATLALATGDAPGAGALTPERIAPTLEAGTPHLDALDRAELIDGYLGALTVGEAERATS